MVEFHQYYLVIIIFEVNYSSIVMARIHLFEFEDLSWFPTNIRNYGTDFLQFVANKFDFYKGVIPILKKGIDKSNSNTIIDLASGGGGGWIRLSEHLTEEMPKVKVHLSDYYPNISAFEATVKKKPSFFSFEKDSVNALNVPAHLKGLRTQFLSFHHFKPIDAKQILQNAIDSNAPIAIFEAQKRDIIHFIKFLFSPINVLITTPFIKPFSFGRIFFTYLLPIVPVFVFWDGLVSVLRTYSKKEMEEMIESLNNHELFDWEVDEKKEKGFTILYLLGTPKKSFF